MRITAVILMSLAAVGAANAAGIFTVVGNDITTNLALANIGTCAGAACTPAPAAFGTGGSYMNTTFVSTSNSVPTVSPNAQNVTTGSGTTPFVIANTSNNSSNSDTFLSTNSTNSLVVDLGTCSGVVASLATCGVFNIANVYTMIQANVATYGFQGVTITLNGTTANGLTALTDTVNLTEGTDYRSTSSAGGVNCTVANSTGQSCAGQTSTTASSTGTDSANGVTVFNNVFGPDSNGAMNWYLDVQELGLGSIFTGGNYLNSITVTSAAGERMMFSGLTLQTAATSSATPEPGTVVLLSSALAGLAFLKVRRSRNAA
jgi:hypothetical protein